MRSRTVTTQVCPARAAISLGETLGLPTKLVDARFIHTASKAVRLHGRCDGRHSEVPRVRWAMDRRGVRRPRPPREARVPHPVPAASGHPAPRSVGLRAPETLRAAAFHGADMARSLTFVGVRRRPDRWNRLPSSSAGVRSGSGSDRSHGRGREFKSRIAHVVPTGIAIEPRSPAAVSWRGYGAGFRPIRGPPEDWRRPHLPSAGTGGRSAAHDRITVMGQRGPGARPSRASAVTRGQSSDSANAT